MKTISLILIQALLSVISGVLASKMSLIGKLAVSVTHREYSVFKTWWKTALIIFAIQIILIFILWVFKKISNSLGTVVSLLMLVIIGFGVYYTYLDFTETSHKHMKMTFHSGFYLAWLGAALSCIFFIITPIKNQNKEIELEN